MDIVAAMVRGTEMALRTHIGTPLLFMGMLITGEWDLALHPVSAGSCFPPSPLY